LASNCVQSFSRKHFDVELWPVKVVLQSVDLESHFDRISSFSMKGIINNFITFILYRNDETPKMLTAKQNYSPLKCQTDPEDENGEAESSDDNLTATNDTTLCTSTGVIPYSAS
jgi:hypothetical protein